MSSSLLTDLRPLLVRAWQDKLEELTHHFLRQGVGRDGLPLLSCSSAGILRWYPHDSLVGAPLAPKPCSLCGEPREAGEFSHIVCGPVNRLVGRVSLVLCDACLEEFPVPGRKEE